MEHMNITQSEKGGPLDHLRVSFNQEHDLLSKANNAAAFLMAYEEAIQLAPREASLHYHKARALEELGRFKEAARADQEARRLGYQE